MRHTAHNFGSSQGALTVERSHAYASARDFCAIFRDDADSLYTLAVSLTGSNKLAQEVFLAALDDCRHGNAVFQEWARPWSRRAVIKNAIRLLDPIRFGRNEEAKSELELIEGEMDHSAGWFLHLARLERFVFVISVLEGYTMRECAVLLGASPREVEQARLRALQHVAGKQNILPASYANNSGRAANSIFVHS